MNLVGNTKVKLQKRSYGLKTNLHGIEWSSTSSMKNGDNPSRALLEEK